MEKTQIKTSTYPEFLYLQKTNKNFLKYSIKKKQIIYDFGYFQSFFVTQISYDKKYIYLLSDGKMTELQNTSKLGANKAYLQKYKISDDELILNKDFDQNTFTNFYVTNQERYIFIGKVNVITQYYLKEANIIKKYYFGYRIWSWTQDNHGENLYISCSHGKIIRIDIFEKTQETFYQDSSIDTILQCQITPDNKYLVSAQSNCKITQILIETKQSVKDFADINFEISDFKISLDNNYLVFTRKYDAIDSEFDFEDSIKKIVIFSLKKNKFVNIICELLQSDLKHFVFLCRSGKFLYVLIEDSRLLCFSIKNRRIISDVKLSNLLGYYGLDDSYSDPEKIRNAILQFD